MQSVSIIDAVKLFFTRYTDFKGRSRRSEYWWSSLALGIVGTVIGLVLPGIAWIWSLIVLIPGLAISVRRLHDIGKSGWWLLINLVPVVGMLLIFFWACKDSTADNQWGPNPKA